MSWFASHIPEVWALLVTHAILAAVPLVIGLVVAIPIGWVTRRLPSTYGPIIAITGLLYTIPSLALFILMPIVLGLGILNPINVVAALTIYTVALLAVSYTHLTLPTSDLV